MLHEALLALTLSHHQVSHSLSFSHSPQRTSQDTASIHLTRVKTTAVCYSPWRPQLCWSRREGGEASETLRHLALGKTKGLSLQPASLASSSTAEAIRQSGRSSPRGCVSKIHFLNPKTTGGVTLVHDPSHTIPPSQSALVTSPSQPQPGSPHAPPGDAQFGDDVTESPRGPVRLIPPRSGFCASLSTRAIRPPPRSSIPVKP